jgi:hypothetical protein
VVAAGAEADAGDVGAVDVDGERRRLVGVAHAVDVAGRGESVDVADLVLDVADQVQLGVIQGVELVLDARDDAERAPGDVVVVRVKRQTGATIANESSGSMYGVWPQ